MSKETIEWLNQNTLIGFTDVRGNAWHFDENHQVAGLENHYTGAIPVEDVRSRLFNFELLRASATFMAGEHITTDPNRIGVMRSDTGDVLGVFKSSYQIHQYDEWLVRSVENLLDDSDVKIGSAGLLRNGAQAWVEIGSDTLQKHSDFEYRVSLLAATSCDGSLATQYRTEVSATVCDNTLAIATREGRAFKTRHTTNSRLKIQNAREVLGLLGNLSDDFASYLDGMTGLTVTDEQWYKFLDEYVPLPEDAGRGQTMAQNKRDSLNDFYFHNDMVRDWNGTAFGVMHAVNTYEHHGASVRGASRAERNWSRMATGASSATDSDVLNALNKVLV